MTPKYTRFDLEQEIISFSMIIEDIKRINEYVDNKKIKNVLNYYDDKYQHLWKVFESLIHNKEL